MTYWTIVHYDMYWSKEGRQQYSRIGGKIPLWATKEAAQKEIKDRMARSGRKLSDEFVHKMEIEKLRKDHVLMGDCGDPKHLAGDSSKCFISACTNCMSIEEEMAVRKNGGL